MLPLHHDPRCRSGVCVSIECASWSCSLFSVVALRVELSADPVISRVWATGPRLPFALSDPYRSRTGLTALKGRRPRTDRRTGRSLAKTPISLRRKLGQPPAHIFHAVKSWNCALFTQWVGRCSNPPLLVFSQALRHLSYRPNKTNKKTRCPYDTGLSVFFRIGTARCQTRIG